jgi:ribosomal-protein-alanine N-acetyltransferase
MDRERTTERFVLRPLATGDAEPLHALWTDEPVRRFLWDGRAIAREETHAIVEESGRLFRERGLGLWAIRARGGDDLVGVAGYWYFRTPPSLELLFAVAAPHWRRGVATEASRSMLGYGFDALGFDAIVASTDPANAASVRVLEKLGMSLRRRESVDGLDTVFYEMVTPPDRRSGSGGRSSPGRASA